MIMKKEPTIQDLMQTLESMKLKMDDMEYNMINGGMNQLLENPVDYSEVIDYEDADERPMFSGVAYVMGNKVTGLNSDLKKPWVMCVRSTRTAVEVETAPVSPFPDDEEYYEKANTFGDIHAFSH